MLKDPLEYPLDYAEVGLISGLEVHQQLMTEEKLFCKCPAGVYTKEHDGTLLRHMRPTLSELGVYDGTALMEFKTKKNIIYLLHRSNVCTYEMDDTPPFLMNQKALDVAIEQCLMLGCDIVDEVHVARKQYLDGSIPTGFQRTAIVGVNGRLPFLGRQLTITQVSLEEDSCREVLDRGHLVVWRTDRLGMPLIETVTGPDLRTPDEVVEAILLIGRVCRSTAHVRVGIGACRQDVNVSVRGGRRVEIKGVPQAWWARRLVHGEAIRQMNLLKLRDELRRRGFKSPEDIVIKHEDVTDIFAKSELKFLRCEEWEKFVKKENRRPGLELGAGPFCVRAIKLVGLNGTLSWQTQPFYDFAFELAGRIRVIACLDQPPILLHSEDWRKYRNSQEESRAVRERLNCGPNDSFVIVWGPLEDTLTAAEEIRLRYIDALDGVPNETRQPFRDGHTDFERILPGPDRMYPDTDSPPVPMMRERIEKLRAALPPVPWTREARYSAVGVPRETIRFLIRRNGAALVDAIVEKYNTNLRQTCIFFGERLKGLKRKGVPVHKISLEKWCEFFDFIAKRPALWEAWRKIVPLIASAPSKTVSQIIEEEGLNTDYAGWENLVSEIVEKNHPCPDDGSFEKRHHFYMGEIMRKLRGKIPASEVNAVLTKKLLQAEKQKTSE
jgi:glutamyl-tRNA(Gln) amidotransferase subunit E